MMTKQISKPYQVKGTAIKNLKNYVNSIVRPGYFEELAKEVGFENANLILPSTWYPVEVFIKAQQVAAREAKIELRKFTIDSSVFILENDLLGIYRFFIRVSGASNVLGRLPQMLKAYANFVELKIAENTDGRLIVSISIPEHLFEWWIPGLEGGIRAILKVSKRDFVSMVESNRNTYDEAGERFLSCDFTLTYT